MRKVTRATILRDAEAVLKKTGVLTRDNYRVHGKFADSEIVSVFGSFANLRVLVCPKRTIVWKYREGEPAKPPPPPPSSPDIPSAENIKTEIREFEKDSAVIATMNPNVKTLDDLLAYMKVDLNVWEVEKHTINKWEVAMREPATTVGGAAPNATISTNIKTGSRSTLWTRGSNKPLHEPLFQVKAWLVRKQPSIQDVAFEKICEKITSLVAQMPRAPRRVVDPHAEHLLEISLHDAHFGLLAWGKETGENYDLKIAEERYETAVGDLLAKTRDWKPEQIVFPVGNDFFHVNNPESVTPKNRNDLDVDGRLCKIVDSGEKALIRALNRCLIVAPVKVLWIPGNHDPETSYFMCRILKAAFSHDPRVEVDVSPISRKYLHYGCNLIGFTHGDEEQHNSLPTIMAGEQAHVWGKVTHREWHLGHFHKKKETRYSAGDTYGGVSVKIIPSICGTDAWHFKKGYVGNDRVAEAFLYNKSTGLVATFTSCDVRSIGAP